MKLIDYDREKAIRLEKVMLFTFCHSPGRYHLLSYYSQGLNHGSASILCKLLFPVCPALSSDMVSAFGPTLCSKWMGRQGAPLPFIPNIFFHYQLTFPQVYSPVYQSAQMKLSVVTNNPNSSVTYNNLFVAGYYITIMGWLVVFFTPGPSLMELSYLGHCSPCGKKKATWHHTP